MGVSLNSSGFKEPKLIPDKPPPSPILTERERLAQQVLDEDSVYAQAQTDIASYQTRIEELEDESVKMHDHLADCADETEEIRTWDCINDIQREIAVCHAKIRKINRGLPAIERQAFDRRIAEEQEKIAELQQKADELKITDEAAAKIAGIDFGTEAALALYRMRQKHIEAMNVLGANQQFLQKIQKIYRIRYENG